MDKIAFFEIEDWEKEYLEKALDDKNLFFSKERLDKDTIPLAKDASIISPFIYSEISKDILESLPSLKFIATRSVGYDHIDIDSCKKKNVIVANIPKYGGDTVAEHTFALILAISRKLIPSIEHTKRGDFSLEGLTGFDLYGKTLGVLGAGHIGKKVIEMGLCFGMKILAFNKSEDEELIKKGVKYVDIDTVLANSDVITLHLPHTKDTEHIINMQNINKFKKGSVLINTARGSLVETQAILEGLEKGILAGAGIDVLEEECSLKEERELLTNEFLKSCDIKTQLLNHVLLLRPDVIITPHNAFNSKEALTQILDITASNIKAFLNGSKLNIVE
ncbi:MAG: NAD(P)-dependent oxidoreductase [Candidatus Levyibacteriota bacterium]